MNSAAIPTKFWDAWPIQGRLRPISGNVEVWGETTTVGQLVVQTGSTQGRFRLVSSELGLSWGEVGQHWANLGNFGAMLVGLSELSGFRGEFDPSPRDLVNVGVRSTNSGRTSSVWFRFLRFLDCRIRPSFAHLMRRTILVPWSKFDSV